MGCVQSGGGDGVGKGEEGVDENNSSWLLADAGGAEAVEQHLVHHSSFRFSFGSHVDLGYADDCASPAAAAGATVLMVNIEKSTVGEDWGNIRQIEVLERSIASAGPRLIRFSYSDICSATQKFCKGKVLGREAKSFVFRGRLGIRGVVPIKRLDEEDKNSANAFYRELMIAGSLNYHRIVLLVGFCVAKECIFLVY